jgi:hypothetical protein
VQTRDLKITEGAAAGAWIEPRLGGEFGAVTLQVPKGYEAYARIFHPIGDYGGKPMRWAEVAKLVARTPHREMQWEELAVGTHWYGEGPLTEGMDFFDLDALCEILSARTADPSDCYFGLSTSRGWLDSFPASQYGRRLLGLPPDRFHIVLAGPLAAVGQITRDGKWRDVPNLIWPADRSWFVVSEVDFDSTLVGGSVELIKAIVESPALEAWQVEPTDSLAFDADKINGTQA